MRADLACRWSTRLLVVAVLAHAACLPAEWGAGAILHPWRRPVVLRSSLPFEDVAFRRDGIDLRGWLFRARPPRRGLVVYLHGIADNRQSGIGIAERLVPRGYDVLAYDSRAHGRSGGDFCTYGFHEKGDVSAALDAVGADRAILFGCSLGAAVALQAAAVEPRVAGIVSISAFSDLHTIASERAPWFTSAADVQRAIAVAERRAKFKVVDVSPRAAAAAIHVPVLLVHGARDRETRPRHSQEIHDRLAGPKRLLIVPEAGHNDVLGHEEVWKAILPWLDEALPLSSPDLHTS
jgi:uncharacterized protein